LDLHAQNHCIFWTSVALLMHSHFQVSHCPWHHIYNGCFGNCHHHCLPVLMVHWCFLQYADHCLFLLQQLLNSTKLLSIRDYGASMIFVLSVYLIKGNFDIIPPLLFNWLSLAYKLLLLCQEHTYRFDNSVMNTTFYLFWWSFLVRPSSHSYQ